MTLKSHLDKIRVSYISKKSSRFASLVFGFAKDGKRMSKSCDKFYLKERKWKELGLSLKLMTIVAAIVEAVKRTGADVRGPVPMPTKIKRYTVLKSPHINKDSREQFEMRIHARMLDIVAATPDTVDSLTKLDLAPEVNVEVRAMGK